MCCRIKEMNTKIGVWSPNEAPFHWSLKPLQTERDIPGNQKLVEGLRDALKKMNIRKAYAPHVAPSSGQVVETALLTDQIRLGDIILYRNGSVPADAIFLEKDHGFVISSAGCPIIIATAGGHMIVAHAGFKSLVDFGLIDGEPTRTNLSVVYSIVAALIKRGITTNMISMCMFFSIPAKMFKYEFSDSRYKEQNRKLYDFIGTWCPNGVIRENGSMQIDLEKIFLQQARMIGVQNARVAHSLSEYPALAHTRDGRKNPRDSDGREMPRRNLIVVKRLA